MTRPETAESTDRFVVYTLILVVFSAVSIASILNSKPLRSANDRSRWCTVWALVERGTYQIDEIDAHPEWHTIDKVQHDGHLYSSKPPLFPTLVSGVYWGLRQITGWSVFRHKLEVTRTILLVVNFLPLLIWLLLLIRIAERHAREPATRYITVAAAAFGTLLTAFQTTLNNHSLGAVSLAMCLYSMSRILSDDRTDARYFALSGFFAALTCTFELPAALFGILSFLLLARHDFRRTLQAYVPAALIPLAAFFVTNWIATGGWKPFYMYYGTEKYRYVIDGVPSYWMSPQGLDQNQESPWTYFLHCVIGHHGIFSLSPIFLLSAAGTIIALTNRQRRLRPLILTGGVLSCAILGFYLSRTQNYNYGGNSAGLRWMFWLTPFWILALIPALDHLWNRWKKTTALLFAVSVFSVGMALPNPWQHPWLYSVMQNAGVINYSVGYPKLSRQHFSWLTQIPAADQMPAEVTYVNMVHSDQKIRIQVTKESQGTVDGIFTRESRDFKVTVPFEIQRDVFESGAKLTDCIVATDSSQQEVLVQYLSCSRFGGELRPGPIRYVKTSLQSDAFRCQRLASRAFAAESDSSKARWYRSKVWNSPDLPFGTVRFEQSATDALTAESVYKTSWKAVELKTSSSP